MAAGKKPPTAGFGKCSNSAAFDPALTAAHCRVYMAIACHGGAAGTSTASRETLAHNLGVSPSTIKRAVKKLIQRGYLEEATPSGPGRSRTLRVLIPPRLPSPDGAQDGRAAETLSKGVTSAPRKGSPVRSQGGHQCAAKGGTSAPQRITSGKRTVEEAPGEEESSGSGEAHPAEFEAVQHVAVVTLCDRGTADQDTLIELETRLASIPNAKTEPRALQRWVRETAGLLATAFLDDHSAHRYMKFLWQVARGERPADDIRRAYKEVNEAAANGKVRESPGQYFFGCLTTGYDGDRAFAEEIRERRSAASASASGRRG